jgi:predicted DNA-binding protein (UPF0251 family)
LPQKQAASIMGVSLKALESLLVRAKRALLKNVAQLQLDNAQKIPDAQAKHINGVTNKSALTNVN